MGVFPLSQSTTFRPQGDRAPDSVSSRHTAGGYSYPEILNPPEILCWCKCLNVVPALLADTAVFAAWCDFRAQNIPKCVCGQGFAPSPLGEITELSRPPSWFTGRGKGIWKRVRKREVIAFPTSFYNLTTAAT